MGALFDIKSLFLPSTVVLVHTEAWQDTAASLLQRFGPDSQSNGFFDDDPVVVDFQDHNLPSIAALHTLLSALRDCRMRPVAYRGAQSALASALEEQGLYPAPAPNRNASAFADSSTASPAAQGGSGDSTQAGQAADSVAHTAAIPTPVGPFPPVVVRKPLRSGQKVYARSADLLLLCPVHSGAEVVADGSIYSYAPLKGRAIAGARGDTQARIVTTCLDAELVCVAGVYCTWDGTQHPDLHQKPAQIWLCEDGQERLVFDGLGI